MFPLYSDESMKCEHMNQGYSGMTWCIQVVRTHLLSAPIMTKKRDAHVYDESLLHNIDLEYDNRKLGEHSRICGSYDCENEGRLEHCVLMISILGKQTSSNKAR